MHSDKERVRARARQLSAESVAAGDATGWIERLYAEAEAGVSVVPWADGLPDPQLVEWADAVGVDGTTVDGTTVDDATSDGPLTVHRIEKYADDEDPPRLRWRAELRRPVTG